MHHVAIQYPSLLLMYEYLSYLSSIQLCNVSQGDMLLKYNVCKKLHVNSSLCLNLYLYVLDEWECHFKRGRALIHHVAYMYVWVDNLFFKRLLFSSITFSDD